MRAAVIVSVLPLLVSACADRAPAPLWPEPPPPTLAAPIGESSEHEDTDDGAGDASARGGDEPSPGSTSPGASDVPPAPESDPEQGAVRIDGDA